MTNDLIPKNTHPEYFRLQKLQYDWHLILYAHDEKDFFTSKAEAAQNYREGIVRDYMVRLQRHLKLRGNQMIFVASNEYGAAGLGHVHILISFDPLRQAGKKDKERSCKRIISKKAELVWNEMKSQMMKPSIQLKVVSVNRRATDQRKVLSYVLKVENGDSREHKHIYYSHFLTSQRCERLLEAA